MKPERAHYDFFLKVNLSHGKPCFKIFNHQEPITQFSYDLNAQLFYNAQSLSSK